MDCSVFAFAWGDARAQHVPTRKRTATAWPSAAWLRAERGGLDGTPRKSWDATQAVSLHSLATLSCHGRRRLQSSGRFSVRQGDGEDGWVCKLFAAVRVGGLVICVARNATPTLSAPLLHCSYKEVYIYIHVATTSNVPQLYTERQCSSYIPLLRKCWYPNVFLLRPSHCADCERDCTEIVWFLDQCVVEWGQRSKEKRLDWSLLASHWQHHRPQL